MVFFLYRTSLFSVVCGEPNALQWYFLFFHCLLYMVHHKRFLATGCKAKWIEKRGQRGTKKDEKARKLRKTAEEL